MFAVVFEVRPNPANATRYMEIAAMLRPELLAIDGFVENERWTRDDDAGVLLSLSLWRDERAVVRWRTHALHYGAQVEGREGVVADYRLRVGQVVLQSADEAVLRERNPREDLTASAGKLVTISIASADRPAITAPLVTTRDWTSINPPARRLQLATWPDMAAGARWAEGLSHERPDGQHLAVRVLRDYGMEPREEAPVFHPLRTRNGQAIE